MLFIRCLVIVLMKFLHFHPRNRFRKPITSLQCQTFEESWISDASRKKWGWVLNTFEQWLAERNYVISNNSHSGEPLINTSLEEMPDE